MSYISFVFAGFVLLTVLLYYLIPKKFRYLVLLGASAIFFMSSSYKLILVVCLLATISFFSAKLITHNNDKCKEAIKALEKAEKKQLKAKVKAKNLVVVVLAIILNLMGLVIFKYLPFLIENTNNLLSVFTDKQIPLIKLVAPIGISYYTLMSISYITDVYRNQIRAERNYFKLLLFLIFFPQIVEGPIGKYEHLSKQLSEGNEFDYTNFQFGLFYIIIGLFKKLVIADRIAIYVDEVFSNFSDYGGKLVFLAIIFYVIQIYADFSGSIEIVTGVSRLFGINLAKNFEQPFFSKNVQEFWRRWHITLGAWLRDYIFYPISLSKNIMKLTMKIKNSYLKAVVPAIIANFAVWMVMGIWHGASWKYVFYGFYYFVIVAIAILLKPLFDKFSEKCFIAKTKVYALFQMIRTFLIVAIGMLFFRAETITEAFTIIKSVFVKTETADTFFEQFSNVFLSAGYELFDMTEMRIIIISILTLVVLDTYLYFSKKKKLVDIAIKMPFVIRWFFEIAIILLILCIGMYGPAYSSNAFIYGGF